MSKGFNLFPAKSINRDKIKKIILFDIDGTLLLTGGIGMQAFDKAFQDVFGIINAWGELIPDGKTDLMIYDEILEKHIKRSVTAQETEMVFTRYTNYFADQIPLSSHYRLMPGIKKLLEELHALEELLLGIATGNIEAVGWAKLARGKLHSFFHFGGFGSDAKDRAEMTRISLQRGFALLGRELPLSAVYVIGDSPYDIKAGRTLGINTVAVATGRATRADLAVFKPDYLFDNLEDTAEFLKIISL